MTVVHFARELQVGETFTILEEACGHGSLVVAGTYKFIDWEVPGLIAVVEQKGERFTLGLEPGQVGVDEKVSPGASFVCRVEEADGFIRYQTSCSCQ